MSSSRRIAWERIDSVLDSVLDAGLDPSKPLTVDDRALVAQLSQGDDDLESEVLALLSEMEGSGDALDTPLGRLLPGVLEELAPNGSEMATPIGRTIDRYRLVEILGRGGMGVVYLAERADHQFDKRVALKLIPTGLESAERERRFLQERQILARLEHPGVARLLDGGMTDEGYPYLVMEWIEGQPIDRHCHENDLGLRQRIELFLEVCDAVEYAHRNLVVHRDIKPGNCLVTTEGRVKLLDFGIAKILAEDGELERTSLQPMTPRYASPEQLLDHPISTATDIYSLGVLLYRLLCGVTPFDLDQLEAHQIRDAVVTRDPPPPSERWRFRVREGAPETPPAETRRRGRQLRGDLDVILLKALRRDPEERYASVRELALDLRRHLDGHPISARRHSVWARARKFASRHRAAVIIALLLASLLMIGVGLVVQQGHVAARERDRARVEAQRARRITRFVTGLLESGSLDSLGGGERTARELVTEAETRIRGELAADPIARASMLDVLASSYLSFGDGDKALELIQEAIGSLPRRHPDFEIEVARLHTTLATVRRGRGEFDGVETLLRSALRTFARRDRIPSIDAARAHRELGGLLSSTGRHEEALENHRTALEIYERESEPLKATLEKTSIAGSLHTLGRSEESWALNREALGHLARVYGPDHSHVAGTRNNMANSLRALGRYREAETLYRQAIGIFETMHGGTSLRIATPLTNLSRVLLDQGRAREAAPHARRAARIMDQALGEDHPSRVGARMNLASVELALGNVEEAVELYRDGLEVWTRITGPGSPASIRTRSLLGSALASAGRHEEAARLLESAIERQRAMETSPLYLAESMVGLARVHESRLDCAEAVALIETSLRLMERSLPPDHWKIEEARAIGRRCTHPPSPSTALPLEPP